MDGYKGTTISGNYTLDCIIYYGKQKKGKSVDVNYLSGTIIALINLNISLISQKNSPVILPNLENCRLFASSNTTKIDKRGLPIEKHYALTIKTGR